MPCTLAGLADDRKGLGQQRVEALATGHALTELISLAAQFLVAEGLDLRLQCVDGTHFLTVLANQPVVAAAENFLEKACDHLIWKGNAAKSGFYHVVKTRP
jgi:hypothetical protein